MKSIGNEIRSIIKKKNVSLYQIAKDLGVTWESLYRSLLNGANPEWKRIGQILDYLDYDFVLKPRRREVNPKKTKLSRSRRLKQRRQT